MKKISTLIIAFIIMITSAVNVFAEQVYLADQGLVITPDNNLKWYTRQAEIGEDDIKYVGGSKDTFKNDMIRKDEYLKLCDASSTYIIHVRIFDTDDSDYTNSMDEKMISDIEEDKVCGHFNTVGVKLSDVSTVSINLNMYGCAKYKDVDSGKAGYFLTMIRNKKMYCFVIDALNKDTVGETEINTLHKLVETVIYKTPDSTAKVDPESQHVQSANTMRNTSSDGSFLDAVILALKVVVLVIVVIALLLILFKSITDKKKLKKKIEFNSRRSINDIDRLNRILNDDFVAPEQIDKEAEEEKKWLGDETETATESTAEPARTSEATEENAIGYMRTSTPSSVTSDTVGGTGSSEETVSDTSSRNSFLAD